MKTVSLKDTKIGTITPLITAGLLQSNAADTFWKSAVELCASSTGKTLIPLYKKDTKASILNGSLLVSDGKTEKGLFTLMLSSDGQHKLVDAETSTTISIVEIRHTESNTLYYGLKIPEDYVCFFSGFIDDLTADIDEYTDDSFTIVSYLDTSVSKKVVTSSIAYSTYIRNDCSVKISIEEPTTGHKAYLKFDVLDGEISYLDSMDRNNICVSIGITNGDLSIKFNEYNEKHIFVRVQSLKE